MEGFLVMVVFGLVILGLIVWSNKRNKGVPTVVVPIEPPSKTPPVEDNSGDKPFGNGVPK